MVRTAERGANLGSVLQCTHYKETAMPGMGELIVILLIVLVVFGANKLPGIGDALGRSIRNFKRASGSAEEEDADEAPAKKKQVGGGKAAKQIEEGASSASAGEGDDEWEEVVVRRRKKKDAAEG
jgi:sec-independent protein translocase protein TatA